MPIVPVAGTWQKWLIKAGAEVGGAVAGYLISQLSEGSSDNDVDEVLWQRVTFEYSRDTPAGTSEDRAQFSIDIVNLTGGDLDPTWTSGDFSTCDAAFDAMITTLRAHQGAGHRTQQYLYHEMHFNPSGWPAKRFADTGAPTHVRVVTPTAGAMSNQAYQVAATVTERTAFPGHWGRAYVPGLGAAAIDSTGRISSTSRTAILGAFETAADALKAAGFYIVVPMTQHNKLPAFGLLSLTQLSVDDIPDVQRRRRPKQVGARSLST